MTIIDFEREHPRSATGQFTDKERSDAEVSFAYPRVLTREEHELAVANGAYATSYDSWRVGEFERDLVNHPELSEVEVAANHFEDVVSALNDDLDDEDALTNLRRDAREFSRRVFAGHDGPLVETRDIVLGDTLALGELSDGKTFMVSGIARLPETAIVTSTSGRVVELPLGVEVPRA